jgi:hypothetical protein
MSTENQDCKKLRIMKEIDGSLYVPVELSSERLELIDAVFVGRNAVRFVFRLKDILHVVDLDVASILNGKLKVILEPKIKPTRTRSRTR